MNHGEYCVNVCHGKCCRIWDDPGVERWRCPKQADSGACTIFAQWEAAGTCKEFYVNLGPGRIMPIRDALAQGLIPDWIERQCCYAHEELLENQ